MSNEALNYTIKDISLADIKFPKEELRSRIMFEGLDELARSIRTVGLMNPITVRPNGESFELIAGFRRMKACEIANLAVVSCRVVNSSDDIADLQRLHENMFRESVNPVDEGSYFKRLLVKNNWRIMDLAVQIHKSPTYVSKRIQLLDADPVVLSALQDGQINISIADELNKITDPEARSRLLYYAINSGATVETVRTWRVQYETDKMFTPPPAAEAEGSSADQAAGGQQGEKLAGEGDHPQRTIVEHVIETRPCYSCLQKTETKDITTLYMCPVCAKAVEEAIQPQQPPPPGNGGESKPVLKEA